MRHEPVEPAVRPCWTRDPVRAVIDDIVEEEEDEDEEADDKDDNILCLIDEDVVDVGSLENNELRKGNRFPQFSNGIFRAMASSIKRRPILSRVETAISDSSRGTCAISAAVAIQAVREASFVFSVIVRL